jgi:Protein of unknown function (DUF2505)
MPRSFDMTAEYDGSVEHVHRAFSDQTYWLARLADSGADRATLDLMEVGEDGEAGAIRIKTTQVLRADRLPGMVAQFHPGDLAIVREEMWSPLSGGTASATVTGAIPGAPVSLTGNAELASAGSGGSRLHFTVTVEVRIPLVGGKVENFIGSQLVELVIAEQRFTTAWIKDNL